MFNPNEALQAILERLDSIDRRFIDLSNYNSSISKEVIESDAVEAAEAAKLAHLGIDRFYAIHKKTFNSIKRRKRLLFSRKEILAYMAGEKIIITDSAVKDAEDFRTKRLKKRLQDV